MHKTGETVTVQFFVSDPATGGLVDADALPTGVLVLNGVDNAAAVTVTNLATGIYRAAVTLPAITDGDELQLRIAATVGGVDGGGIVWQGYGVTKRPVDVTGGAYTQTVTVTSDGSTPIPNATVEIWSGDILVSTKTTSAIGVASPSCNAGSYTLKILATGYNDYSAALTVAGNATVPTITLEEITSPASTDPDAVTVRWRVKKADRSWAGAGDATVYIQIVEGPNSSGVIWHGDNENFDSEDTNANGYVNFTNVPVPCTLAVRTGTSRKIVTVDIPSDATSPYDAGEIVSQDA